MRFWLLIALGAGVAACAGQNIAAVAQEASCKDVSGAVKLQSGIRPSDHLVVVEQLACLYGLRQAEARDECQIDPGAPEYFGNAGRGDVYGIKKQTALLLIDSESFGTKIAGQRAARKISEGLGVHDLDNCLSSIHDLPRSFDDLVAATRSLRGHGY